MRKSLGEEKMNTKQNLDLQKEHTKMNCATNAMSGERRRKRNHVEFVTRSKNGKLNGEKTYAGTTNLV